MNKIRIAVNGFGRIGRLAARIIINRDNFELCAINSRASASSHAYLLKYDTSYGVLDNNIQAAGNNLQIDDHNITVYQESDPAQIPWAKHNIDIVLETTGAFRKKQDCQKHLQAGAKKVVISAPPKDEVPTVCMGVNHTIVTGKDTIVSNASCTTNCTAAVLKVISDSFSVVKGFMTTTHAYTDSQNLLDNSHKKELRQARSAPNNIIPASSGATKALALVLPQLKDRIIASALRVPVATISLIDLTVQLTKPVNKDELLSAFRKASQTNLKNILAVSTEPLVSSDIKNSNLRTFSAVVDEELLQVNGDLVNIKAWYDNEYGYSSRLVDLAEYISDL